MRTRAEQALVEQFEVFSRDWPDKDAAQSRRTALEAFKATGLPHRRIEEWKYTDLRSRVTDAYPPAEARPHGLDTATVDRALGPFASLDALRLVLLDGRFAPELSRLDGLDSEAGPTWVMALRQRGPSDPLSRPLSRSALAASNLLTPLHDAYVTDGALVRLPGAGNLTATGVARRPSKPLLIVHLHTAKVPERVATRTEIDVGPGRAITIIEVHCRIGDAPVQALESTMVSAGADTNIDHVKVVRQGAGQTQHLGHTDVVLGQRASFRGFQMTMGQVLARHDVTVTFNQPDSKIDLAGLMLGRGEDHIDTTIVVEHRDTGSQSRELFKAVLEDEARAVFQGKVVVQPAAQKTDGKMMAQALMLSPRAEFDSKPELEIYADDVVCGHGSTVAELDPDHVFYLKTRGIPTAEARALLIHAFIGEPIDKVTDEALRSALRAEAAAWLGTSLAADVAL
jgi:Fe-S cluster assembly protein SufD